ncbi:MAG: hypothetical protein ABSF22_13095 [Bryobacteraceae bacterium]
MNFPRTFAKAADLIQYPLRDAGVSEGQRFEGYFKAAGACPQIMNLFRHGIAVQLH